MRTPKHIVTIIAAGAIAVAAGATAVAVADHPGNGNNGMGQRQGVGTGNGSTRGMGSGAGGTMGRRAGMGGGSRMGQRSGMGQPSRAGMGDAARLPARTNQAPLSTSESAAVTYMREEEKLARDVYVKLADTSGNPVFTRIAASEQRHMDALGRVITRYGLTDPTQGKAAGQFQNQALQQLYNQLTAKGSASPAAAVEVGRSIEKLDIADLNSREATSKHADVRWVFQQLERGSNMHLRAFNMQTR
jgi:hypothetical protein